MKRPLITLGLTLLVIGLGVSDRLGIGRRLWYPTLLAMTGTRTHEQVIGNLGRTRRAALAEALAAPYPPANLTLVGLKAERRLEVWTESATGWTRLRDYAVLAASGGPGPKMREGDLQVP